MVKRAAKKKVVKKNQKKSVAGFSRLLKQLKADGLEEE